MKTGERCKFCYASVQNRRYRWVESWGPQGDRKATQTLKDPLKWNKDNWLECPGCGWRGSLKDVNELTGFRSEIILECPECSRACHAARQRVFAGSLMDVGDEHPSIKQEWREEMAQVIKTCTNMDFLMLTGRIEAMSRLWVPLFGGAWPENVWVGTSISSYQDAEDTLLELAKVEAKVRFVSCEPMLTPVNMRRWLPPTESKLKPMIDWVICGAESGTERRKFNPEWMSELYVQCSDASVPFFCKQGSASQSGKQGEIPDWLWEIKQFPRI